MNSTSPRPDYALLRVALLANALFSVLSGLGMLFLSRSLAPWLGTGIPAPVVAAIGIALVPFGGLAAWVGTRQHPPTWLALLISVADLAWVIGSAGLVVLSRETLSGTGIALVVAVALVVFGFAAGQLLGIARAYRVGTGKRQIRVCIEVRTDGDAEVIWRNVADMGNIARFAPMLATSGMRAGAAPGIGAVRECSDRGQRRWAERCLRLDRVNREFDVEFLADEPDFPFPFEALRGGWRVRPEAEHVVVRIWWEGALRRALLASVVPALFAWQAKRHFAVVVGRMAGSNATPRGALPSRLSVVPC